MATISSAGLVKGIKQGTATITVTTADGGFTETCKITVAPATVPVTSLVISASEMTIGYLEGCTLRAWPQPTYATNREVIWGSSNPNVATVTSNGTVYSTYEYGTAIITAKTVDGGFTKTCKITVK